MTRVNRFRAIDPHVEESHPKTIELALQGGAHGALTWGVLDRLLQEPRLKIEGVSGTSAGAMNAVALADGLQASGAEGARSALELFWRKVNAGALSSPIQRDLWSRLHGDWGLENSPGYLFSTTSAGCSRLMSSTRST